MVICRDFALFSICFFFSFQCKWFGLNHSHKLQVYLKHIFRLRCCRTDNSGNEHFMSNISCWTGHHTCCKQSSITRWLPFWTHTRPIYCWICTWAAYGTKVVCLLFSILYFSCSSFSGNEHLYQLPQFFRVFPNVYSDIIF